MTLLRAPSLVPSLPPPSVEPANSSGAAEGTLDDVLNPNAAILPAGASIMSLIPLTPRALHQLERPVAADPRLEVLAGPADDTAALNLRLAQAEAELARIRADRSEAELRRLGREVPTDDTGSRFSRAPTEGEAQVAGWLRTTPEKIERYAKVKGVYADGTVLMADGRKLTRDEALVELRGGGR